MTLVKNVFDVCLSKVPQNLFAYEHEELNDFFIISNIQNKNLNTRISLLNISKKKTFFENDLNRNLKYVSKRFFSKY